MKDKIRNAIEAALDKAGVAYDTDGENIWIDDAESGKTYGIDIKECAE